MAGVPNSRGCDACRRQKKKCDQAQPICSRCARLKTACVGSGVKRFVFKSENQQAAKKVSQAVVITRTNPTPAPVLSNEKTLISGKLVHILNLDDPAYDISTFGLFVVDLPRYVGSSKSLDAAISAFVAGFGTLKNKTMSKIFALDRYVYAIKMLRETMNDPVLANTKDSMCSIYLIAICQEWLGHASGYTKHYEMLGHLIQNSIQKPSFDPSDLPFMQTILGAVILESFNNPNIQLGPWYWQAMSLFSGGVRPLKSGDGMSFTSLDLATMAELSWYLREPDKYLYQIRSTYAVLRAEQPRLIQIANISVSKARETCSTSQQRRLGMRFHSAIAAMLTMGIVLNRIIRVYDGDPTLMKEAQRYVDEIIDLGIEASSNRPIAAASIATPLTIALAAVEDYRYAEVEVLLLEYQTDFAGLHYFDDVERIRRQFENIDKSYQKKRGLLTPNEQGVEESLITKETEMDIGPGCTIL
ncbi:hypothetical protein FVEN_g6819 [Fusarium venenatum]|uniref:Zn(2)-C6 fungal-type domain-containing protein n=1 Tax=Fusarium venenatum TaxID=56646 RepID=A0A2L2T242_9HYPO|nr:uncharacterized protein FVRRES_00210 [Fusarium venenatum]KAG8355383.1 hypothetical protein FVEN_g6819 [Fusarium venenatum]CEI63698.1 unnamed protein product [Fusarium venenatum]